MKERKSNRADEMILWMQELELAFVSQWHECQT